MLSYKFHKHLIRVKCKYLFYLILLSLLWLKTQYCFKLFTKKENENLWKHTCISACENVKLWIYTHFVKIIGSKTRFAKKIFEIKITKSYLNKTHLNRDRNNIILIFKYLCADNKKFMNQPCRLHTYIENVIFSLIMRSNNVASFELFSCMSHY